MKRLPRFVLVINAENTTRVVNYDDRASAVLWGDGTSAAVVSTSEPSRVRVVEATLDSNPAGASLVTIPRFGHFAQDGSAVQRFAIRTTLECLERMLPAARDRLASSGGSLRFIGHQANLLMLENVVKRAGLAPREHWFNVVDRGNTGAAGAPSVLSEHWDELGAGDVVVLVVVGSGLTWSSLRIEVA
jgi:3-oxoacyl-[acyl-carrier-protein] synthase-3